MRKRVKPIMAILLVFLMVTALLPERLGGWWGRAYASTGIINTVAGNGTNGYAGDGAAAGSANLAAPSGVAEDSRGYLYIADTDNHRIRKVAPNGIISTVAGNGTDGYSGDGGAATSAQLRYPRGVAVDSSGNLYIADSGNHSVRKVDQSGIISTVAGNGDGGDYGDGYAATGASLYHPTGVAVDSSGNLYIADSYNHRIRKVDTLGVIWTVAGTFTSSDGGYSGDGGYATYAELYYPTGVAVDSRGNLYIADSENHRIRKVDTSGIISTVAGNGTDGYSGDGGTATSAQLRHPRGVAVDRSGNLYIADYDNHRIRKVESSGMISTVAGTGDSGYSGDEGTAASAQLNSPYGVAVGSSGNLYIADYSNLRIRKVGLSQSSIAVLSGLSLSSGSLAPSFVWITTNYTAGVEYNVKTLTVTPTVMDGMATVQVNGDSVASGQASGAIILNVGSNTVTVVVTAQDGTTKTYTINVTRAAFSGMIETVAGTGTAGYSGDNRWQPTDAQLSYPQGVAIDSSESLYIVDSGNERIRKVYKSGYIDTVAGNGDRGYSGDGRQATDAQLRSPEGAAVDSSGNLYIADMYNNRIRKVAPNRIISTVAGTGNFIYYDDGSIADVDILSAPAGVAVDSSGNLYIADRGGNSRIRKVAPNGIISTVAGARTTGYSGDGGAATSAQLYGPAGMAVDSSGNLYIADSGNNRIRKVDTSGIISTVAGTGTGGYSGDGGAATSAQLRDPTGVAVDSSGNLYIADSENNRIRKVDTSGLIWTVAGTGTGGYSGDGGAAASAQLRYPRGVAVDSSGNLYIADSGNNRIRKVELSAYLSELSLSSGPLAPAFALGTMNYTASVANNVTSLTVTPTLAGSNAMLFVYQTQWSSGEAYKINLGVGTTTVWVTVKGQYGILKRYEIVVTRAAVAPPTNLNTTTTTDKSVTFSWTAPEGTGVAGYDIYRNNVKIGSTTDTFYTDSGLSMGTVYSYTVRAKDLQGNASSISASLNVRTKDTQAPSVPKNVAVSSKTDSTITLNWTAATDNVGVTGYHVFRDANLAATVTNATYTDSGLAQGTNYSYTVSAIDAAGNESDPSIGVSVLTVDTEAPTLPANLKITQTPDFTTLLKWDASTDNIGVVGYHIYSNLKKIATVTGTTSYTVSNANNGATSLYNVTAFDEAGNESPLSGNADHAPDGSGTITVSTGSVITDELSTIVFRYTAPSGGLHNGSVAIDVPAGWTVPNPVYGSRGYATASTGVLSISGQTLTVTGITLPDGGEMTITYSDVTSPGTSGTYTFNAKSKMTISGTLTGIAASPQVMVASDSTQPTWDANGVLSFSNLSTNGLTVSWPAASDQIGITKYEIWRNGYLLSTVMGNVYSYHDGGLSAGELYTYLLKAYDAAGNAADGPSTGVNTNTWMTINAGSIPSGTRGIPYKTSLSAAGGTSPYTWSVIGLPSGLTFDSSKGVIAGIPLSEGISSVTASVYDRLGQRIGLSFDITVNPPAMNIVSTSLATGTLGMPYQELLTASGGSSDYTWNVEGLPAGIILDTSTGKLSGVPSAAGTYLLNVSVSDRSSPGLHASHSLSLVINFQVLTITTTVLPIGITGTAYSAVLATTGGTPLHVWNAAGLPAGLSINSATGVISGIPAAAGVYSVTVTLTDNNGSNANVGLSLLVNPASSTGKYTVTPQTDPSYTVGATADGIAVMTVNSGVSGFTYFTVNISPVEAHSGNETAVFVLIRNGVQLSINATEADFDSVNRGRAGFNVQAGDVVKSFLVDNLSNSPGFNPTLLK